MNGITILQGDVREVLRTLPDESVHCVVTSPPLDAYMVQFFCAQIQGFHTNRKMLRPQRSSDVLPAMRNPSQLTRLLDFAERKTVIGLLFLDAEIGQDRSEKRDGLTVSGTPAIKRLTALGAGVFHRDTPAKATSDQLYCLSRYLSDVYALAVGGCGGVLGDPHGICGLLYSDCSVGVEDTGDVGAVNVCRHGDTICRWRGGYK